MKRKSLKRILKILPFIGLMLLTSCSLTDTWEFGGGVKVPAFLVYGLIIFAGVYFLTHSKKKG